MSISTSYFGCSASGSNVNLYLIQNCNGMTATVTNYGAILVSLIVPCPDGSSRDVVLGYDTLQEYENGGFLGATVGRHANRISGAAFSLDGTEYHLTDNDNGCNLHSDFKIGFHKQVWNTDFGDNYVRFSRCSPNGEAGFPGNLNVNVSYTLDSSNGLHIIYEGVSDQKTLINLTNHSFFNLSGHDTGSILSERVTIFSDYFLEIDSHRIPTGRILPVAGTPMDFRNGKILGSEIDAPTDQLCFANGYDHCFVTGTKPGSIRKIALVEDTTSGLSMETWTDLPGVQFYTANFLPLQSGKLHSVYGPRCALCLETEYYPDSIHHPEFIQAVFSPNERYHAETVYRFL